MSEDNSQEMGFSYYVGNLGMDCRLSGLMASSFTCRTIYHIITYFYFLRQDLSLNLQLTDSTRLAGQWAPGMPPSSPPQCRGNRHTALDLAVLWVLGISTQVLMHSKHFSHWVTFSSWRLGGGINMEYQSHVFFVCCRAETNFNTGTLVEMSLM